MNIKKIIIFVPLFLFAAFFTAGTEIPLNKWLILEADVTKPPFTGDSISLLDYSLIDTKSLWPEEGQKFHLNLGKEKTWIKKETNSGDLSILSDADSSIILAANYLNVHRWMKASLIISGNPIFKVFLDGKFLSQNPESELILTPGHHRLLVVFFQDKGGNRIEASLRINDLYKPSKLVVDTDPTHNLNLEEALTFPQPGVVEVSPNGIHFAISNSDGNLELRKIENGDLVRTISIPPAILSFDWSPDGSKLAIASTGGNDISDIWLVNLKSGESNRIFTKIKGTISQLKWLADEKYISFKTTEPEQKQGPYDLIDNFLDRWEGWQADVNFWIASIDGKARHLVSSGLNSYGFAQQAIVSPDGKKVVFIHTKPHSSYPYRREELWMVDLVNRDAELISEIKTPMVQNMTWGPDSKQIAVIAPYYNFPRNPEEVEEYHSRWHQGIQLWDIEKKTYQYLTSPSFDPCVQSLWWNSKDKSLYFIALDRTVHRLYKFTSELNEFSEVELPFRNIEAVYGTPTSNWVILRLAELDKPSWLVAMDLETKDNHKVWDKGAEFLSRAHLAKTEKFDCMNREGTKLDGWIYLPPNFDPEKKYPAIISYYGGVVPQTESFGGGQFGRINHWLACQDYIVYTMTPRGTWGYGQEFADAHFNEWGTVSAPDIIDAVKALIKAKPFINAKRIGGFGHSYGGFEGLSLATQTDLFATIIATGVISNTLNYSFIVLGQTNMGEIVLPGVFPWNRKDVYVDRSPVFNADKVNTPILLMQGTDDPWCEMTESDQMYSALKVQGKGVVQIRWIGQGHGIRDLENRIINENIRLEWFDKYLKDEPEGWNERYEASRK